MRPLVIMHGENIDWCHTVIRMLMYLVGVAVLALGMSLQTASGLGVAALTCFATTLSMLTGKTLGFWITATYVAYIVAQLAILRSEFQPRILLELFFSTLIGGLTDLFMAVNPLHPTALPTQIATMLLSLAVTAFGVSLVVNMGVGDAATDSKLMDAAVEDLRVITGQQPMITRARKSIATFRLRAGMPIGCKVTLRGDRMWEFFDRLTSVAIPRIRDFRGISAKSFDGRGNFSMGVTEQLIFPEIDFDSVDHQRGMDITFVTTANTDEEAKALLDAFGFPFKK